MKRLLFALVSVALVTPAYGECELLKCIIKARLSRLDARQQRMEARVGPQMDAGSYRMESNYEYEGPANMATSMQMSAPVMPMAAPGAYFYAPQMPAVPMHAVPMQATPPAVQSKTIQPEPITIQPEPVTVHPPPVTYQPPAVTTTTSFGSQGSMSVAPQSFKSVLTSYNGVPVTTYGSQGSRMGTYSQRQTWSYSATPAAP